MEGKVRVCRNCGMEFTRKIKKIGYVDQCDDCSTEEVETYVGRRNDKHGDTEIFRTNIVNVTVWIQRENAIGRHPNLGVSHPIVEQSIKDRYD